MTVELWTLPAPSFRKDLFSKLFETIYCCVRRTGEPLHEENPIWVKLAGQMKLERTVSSPEKSKPHLVEMIEFIHTEPWRSKTFLEEKYVKNAAL